VPARGGRARAADLPRREYFTADTYTVPHVRAAVFWRMSSTGQADAWLTFAQWRAQGNDVDGTLIPLD
jgi:hypothetical protein